MKRLLIVVGVLVALLAVADVAARIVSEQALAVHLQRSLHLSEKPSVSVSGFPFLLHLVSGDVPSLTVEARGVREGSVRFDRVRVTLDGLRFGLGRLIGGDVGTIRATGGEGTAEMTAGDLEGALRAAGLDARVRMIGGDRVAVSGGGLPPGLQARLRVHGQTLDIEPVTASAVQPLSLQLPSVVHGLRYTGVRIEGGRAVLSFRLDHPSIEL